MRLDGVVCIITGGTSGIGRAAVELFVREGATVVTVARGREAGKSLVAELGERAVFEQLDVADTDALARLVVRVAQRFGRLDVVVNNAGVLRWGPFVERGIDDLDATIGVHLRPAFVLARAAVPVMARGGGGSIINVGSIVGLKGVPGSTPMSAVKGALLSLTRTMAVECAPLGVRVNAVVPGLIATPMLEDAIDSGADPASERATMQAGIPMGRFGTPAEIAQAMLFFADSAASGYVTGAALSVDGGMAVQ